MRNYIAVSAALLVACGVAAFGSGEHETASSSAESRPPILLDGGQGEAIAFPAHPTLRLADPDSNIAGMSFFEIRIRISKKVASAMLHKENRSKRKDPQRGRAGTMRCVVEEQLDARHLL